jgi:hypothetical protein
MATETRRITGLPTKKDAEMRVSIWKATPGYIDGSGRVEKDPQDGWTAEAQFQVADSP